MNKRRTLAELSLLVCLILAMVVPLNPARGGLKGSRHDFSAASWNPGGQLCQPCHTPHTGSKTVPLWNHDNSIASFTMYNNTANSQNSPAAEQPSSVSLSCLSCHDGVTALDAFGGNAGTWNIANAPDGYRPSSSLGTDLSSDHPISIDYTTSIALDDKGLYDPKTAPSGLPAGGSISKDMLYNGRVECSSCHDVHNKMGISRMLKKDNAGSALCLTCHDK